MSGTVFVVDQDAHLAKLVSSVVVPAGFSVSTFTCGRAALQGVQDEMPLLVIVGEKNDQTDGVGWIAKLREKERRLPVAFVAAKWREPEFYRVLREELNVALVAHRPLKPSILKIQLADLLTVAPITHSDLPTPEMPVPYPSGNGDSGLGPGLEKWRRAFVASIPGRMEKLGGLLTAISITEDRQKTLQDALIVAHNLKGTSLSWGFSDLGDTAGRIEEVLKKSDTKNGGAPSPLEDTAALFFLLNEYAHTLTGDDAEPTIQDETRDVASDKAHILVVGDAILPYGETMQKSGIGVEMIHTSYGCAIADAGKVALDAALIEISQNQDTESSFNLARQLRDLHGYENLPLAFIVPNKDSQLLEGSARAHAGGSLVIERPMDSAIVDKVIGKLLSLAEGGRFRVMVVDDDPDMSSLLCRCLGQFGIFAISLNDPLQVSAVLNEFNPDLLLLDVLMPGMTGFEVCKKLRQTDRWRDLPIIFLTAQTDLASRITAYEAGADDYLPKPVINVELLTRVKARLEKARELKERSERDLLTGLLMRRPFSEQSNSLISEAQRHGFEFTVALLDVDHFKKVNDTYGHDAGDLVLAMVGKLLRKRFRVEDLRGRWGGEEFILAFRHENIETMKRALTRVLEELKSIEFNAGDSKFSVSFSAGLSCYPIDGKNLHGLVQVADRRLYLAKNRGRSVVVTEG